MRIAIEAQRLFRTHKHGMDIYALELIRNLQEIDHENEYFIFVKPDQDDAVIRETPNFKIVRLAGGFYPLWEQIALPKAVKRAGCQILHCTSNTAPVFSSTPLVLTLHDIIYMERSYFSLLFGSASPYQKFGNMYRKLVVPLLVSKSRKKISVSESEKKNIDSYFALEGENQVKAMHNGVSMHFKPVTDATELKQAREQYHLPDNYFFYLGNTDPKKNTAGTLRAFSAFISQTGSDYKLVMADFSRPNLEKLLQKIDDQTLIDKIVLPGYINNANLPAVYSQCKVFLYPSLRESFGIPIIEAMACGVPVITSGVSSLPEVAGDAAFMVDPEKPEELTTAMIRLVNEPALRDKLIKKGFERIADFSWLSTATNVMNVYREINASLTNLN
ncbi:MAG: glycosyltransferase family 4 protein [Lentimicrobium sp.]